MIKFNIIFIIKNYLKLNNCLKGLKESISRSVLILVFKIINMVEILLVGSVKKISSVLGFLENSLFTFNNPLFSYTPDKSLKFMDKTSKDYIHFKAKLPIWFIIFKESINLEDFLSLIENQLLFI